MRLADLNPFSKEFLLAFPALILMSGESPSEETWPEQVDCGPYFPIGYYMPKKGDRVRGSGLLFTRRVALDEWAASQNDHTPGKLKDLISKWKEDGSLLSVEKQDEFTAQTQFRPCGTLVSQGILSNEKYGKVYNIRYTF